MKIPQFIVAPVSGAMHLAFARYFPENDQLRSKRNKAVAVCVAGCVVLMEASDEARVFQGLGKIARLVALCGSGVLLGDALFTAKDAFRNTLQYRMTPFHRSNKLNTKSIVTSDPKECAEIIKGATLTAHGITNALSGHEARAMPNQRLKAAFDISNCFITGDKNICKEFRDSVEDKLYVTEPVWQKFAAAAKTIVKSELGRDTTILNLFEVVQLVCMKMVRKIIWNMDADNTDADDAVRLLAHEVNEQWIRSKDASYQPGDDPDWAFAKQDQLQSAMRRAFPGWRGESEDNPMNFILPGYETLWRVVLRCFVELTSRSRSDTTELSKVLVNFLNNPTSERLTTKGSGDLVGPAMISKEALRLYPPTRRIYRQYRNNSGEDVLAAADVETMHRDPKVWGPDALLFKPTRWQNKNVDRAFEEANFLAFGAAPFRCPAKRIKDVPFPFGVTIIAVITAALIQGTQDRWVCEGEFPVDDRPLATARQAYKDAVLRFVGRNDDGASG